MLSGLHFLLTYTCLYECEHCFLYCSPRSRGTFTLAQFEAALRQGIAAGIDTVYFEGGEPFLYYPLLVEGVRLAKARGLRIGIVTNGYWAHSERDAELWLEPLARLGIDDFSVSNDAFHSDDPTRSPAAIVASVAARLGMATGTICLQPPVAQPTSHKDGGGAVVGGDVLFKGRAADQLTAGLPRQKAAVFDRCPHEELEHPARVHLDPFGDVFVCQGISIGNVWQRSLVEILSAYQPAQHAIVGPLLAGGPAELGRRYGLATAVNGYVDHCHLCFAMRRQLLSRLPEQLCPEQIYGGD